MDNMKDRIIKIFDVVTIIVAITICIGAFIIDGYNSLVKNEIQMDYAFVSTTLLLSIAIHFILSSFTQNDINQNQLALKKEIEESVEKIIGSLDGVEVTFFDDINKVDIYIAEKISTASNCVYDFNWQDYTDSNPYHRSLTEKEYAATEIDKSIKSFCSKRVAKPRIYKEIFTFSYPKNLGKMLAHLEYGNNYNCSYYENKEPNSKFPKLQFVIIDDEEVIFVSSAYKPNLCSIKNKRIASIFCCYFEQAWELSEIIKNGKNINSSIVEKIKKTYGAETDI